MNRSCLALLVFSIAITSCSPSVKTSVIASQKAQAHGADIVVYGVNTNPPTSAKTLGSVKISDTGFTLRCTYDIVLALAKVEARKIGGNALKLVEHKTPTALGSSCHRITAQILFVAEGEMPRATAEIELVDSVLLKQGCAKVHFYRYGGIGSLVGYNVHVGDSIVCRVQNDSKETVKICTSGKTVFWAKTETREDVTLTLEAGKEYFVRCGIEMGAFVGRPTMLKVDYATGKVELESIDDN